MDCEPEELQFLKLFGIYREAVQILKSQRKLFSLITVAFILPLCALFLVHIHVSHALFSHIDSDDTALDSAPPGSASESRLLHRLASDWAHLLLFKAVYLICLLVFSLLSTSAVVYTVASMYSAKDGLSFPRILSVVPKVWRRLMATFLSAFILLIGYHTVFVALFLLFLLVLDDGDLAAPFALLLLIVYLAGLVYVSVIWHVASVLSVLEESKGFDAMRRSRALLQGKFWTAVAIFVKLNMCFAAVEVGFRLLVVKGGHSGLGVGARIGYGLVMLALLCLVVLFALVVQTVVYFVCKSYHHESIDKSNLSDHLEVYLGDYVPLRAKDVQLEQFNV